MPYDTAVVMEPGTRRAHAIVFWEMDSMRAGNPHEWNWESREWQKIED